jgi:hypothetical protein
MVTKKHKWNYPEVCKQIYKYGKRDNSDNNKLVEKFWGCWIYYNHHH